MHASLFEGFYLERDVLFIDLIGDTIKGHSPNNLKLAEKCLKSKVSG